MTPEELLDRLTLSGYSARVQRDEVLVEVCWYCGNDRWNLELNAGLGVAHCWACRSSSRLDALLARVLGSSERIPVRLEESSQPRSPAAPAAIMGLRPASEIGSARTYLERRGLSVAEMDRYDLGVCVEQDHLLQGRITIPARDFWTGEVLGHWGRSYTGSHPKYRHTLAHRVIAGWRMRERRIPVVISEGPFDGLAVHRAGFSAAVLSGTPSEDVQTFVARLDPATPLALLLDAEAREEADRLYWMIAPIRPATRLDLPGQDPGAFDPRVLRRFISQGIQGRS